MMQWIRYHDDVIAIFSNRECMKSGVALIKSRAEPVFKVAIEGVYSAGTSFSFFGS